MKYQIQIEFFITALAVLSSVVKVHCAVVTPNVPESSTTASIPDYGDDASTTTNSIEQSSTPGSTGTGSSTTEPLFSSTSDNLDISSTTLQDTPTPSSTPSQDLNSPTSSGTPPQDLNSPTPSGTQSSMDMMSSTTQPQSSTDDEFFGELATTGISANCLQCICKVEGCERNIGQCNPDPTPSQLACGPFQIHQDYYADCGSPENGWQSCTKEMVCSQTCVRTYTDKYGPGCAKPSAPTCETYARIHNGGPQGCHNANTDGYWDKVSQCCNENGGC